MSYLGLDIGTSGCKAVVYCKEGVMLKKAYREYSLLHPAPGHAELNSEEVIKHCFDVIREVNTSLKDPVTAMCISSQGEAFTAVGHDGSMLCNGMISSDCRAVIEVEQFTKEFGSEKLYQITGHTSHPIFSLFKLIWLKKNKPEIWNKAKYFLCFEDLLIFKLGLNPHISWPLAGRTMMFDIHSHSWSNTILDKIGLKSSKLANPVPTGTIVGTIPSDIAASLGFVKEVKVVAGGHDQTVGSLGAGVIEPGMCMYATGTVECFCPMLDKVALTDQLRQNNLCCYDFTLKGKYTTVAYSLTGGNILKWFRDEFGQPEKQKSDSTLDNVYSLLLEQMPEEPTDLLVLPYFSPTGTPYFDTRAKGAVIGLQITTKRTEFMKALLEGVALEMRLNLELMEQSGMEIKSFIATGGGAKNEAWVQLKADVLNRPVKVSKATETGCFGAAMIAQSAEKNISVEMFIRQQNKDAKTFYPDASKAAVYSQKFEKYKTLYHALKAFF